MPISIDSALGIHTKALVWRARRARVLASNLANAETPHYKARDLDFRAVLRGVGNEGVALKVTHAAHLPAAPGTAGGVRLLYRVPLQASLDGNTVDPQLEKAAFAENAVRYQATLRFLDGKIKGLMTAIKGE